MQSRLKSKLSPGIRGALFYLLFWGVIGIFDPFINVYLDKHGLSGPQIGWLSALYPFFSMFLPLLLARLVDHLNRRILTLALIALGYGLALILFPIPRTFLSIAAAMVLMAAFRSPIAPIADGLVARMSDKYAIDFGRMRLWGSLGFTLTAIALASIWRTAGYAAMFITGGVLFFTVAFAATLLEEAPPPRQSPVARQAQLARLPIRITKDPLFMILLGATFLVGVGMSMGGTFSGIYMARLGGNEMQIGAILGISSLFEVPAMAVGRKIFDRIGGTNTLISGFALVIVSFTGFSLSHTPWALLFFTGFKGFGFGLYYISLVKLINDRAPEALSTTYQSIMYALGWGIAPLIGSPLSGILFDSLGPSRLFLISAGVVVIAILLLLPTYAIWHKEQKFSELILAGEENATGSNS